MGVKLLHLLLCALFQERPQIYLERNASNGSVQSSKSSSTVFFIMTIIISLLLLASLLPHLTFTARMNVGIVNGREAKPHSRPYMVSVQAKKQHICGGFLISDRFVMTAAHCREIFSVLTVVLGAHDLQQTNLDRIKVDFYHEHPNYNKKTFHNDIMLLRLEKHVELNDNIKWISIPMKEDDIEADTVCSVAGWGSLKTNGTGNNRLMETDVTVLNNKECESKWGKKDYSTSEMMCVYGNGGSCNGDSGGPLVCGKTAVGVTSFGDPDLCNSSELPEVYIKVSAYLPWIHMFIGNVLLTFTWSCIYIAAL
ncbi:mast cell protease 1A-like isoform X1 [Ctenopharyngodon idella]|uniref:mast cell protease 1A-like isoform X1 n=1 Tax=Ctenopharyngodon idella TaxID=7959 RepID=UPI00222EB727|nr:mast cell protease 1A-like isoform X1 [Ctenopharyngodon idella]